MLYRLKNIDWVYAILIAFVAILFVVFVFLIVMALSATTITFTASSNDLRIRCTAAQGQIMEDSYGKIYCLYPKAGTGR